MIKMIKKEASFSMKYNLILGIILKVKQFNLPLDTKTYQKYIINTK